MYKTCTGNKSCNLYNIVYIAMFTLYHLFLCVCVFVHAALIMACMGQSLQNVL